MTTQLDSGLWLRRYHPAEPGAVRLVCLPHAGGSASFFFPVSKALAPKLDVISVQYPGRQDRRADPCIDSIAELADRVYEELVPQTEQPFAFFGHSMGATLAFEVALRLEQRLGRVPVALFASGRRAPSAHREEFVHLRDDDGLVAELKQLSGTDSKVLGDEEVLRMVLPAIRGDYKAAETYRYQPGPKLSCPVTVLVGDADPKVDLAEARAWQEHTTGDFELKVYPGGHFYLASRQAEVLGVISAQLG
ncbi:alpha/beta fold hydrolase [Kutzneria viridogrisea]|uniref:Surfactin synthase thioesterase subunit n=2 Tax=Kutzneria TaxID=43356 RepID=A0ABR6BTL8_9PSEU|nr:alpha/beta fold hydrolase [Kutzneria albida]AHH94588.1 putative cadicidin biosynthesis thioesterase [Kutzneria albida DSM 43870]MBA8930256.1 surfactin synthase thioesterase subunit [Kutzneria viridogrisea]